MEDHQQNITLGTATNHYADFPVRLSHDDRLRHMVVFGKTGTGKSTFLQHMALSDMLAGNGFAFFDPHGQAVRELLDYIPPDRMRDVIYLNGANSEHVFGYNILENVPEKERDRVTQQAVGTFQYLWSDSWGARMHNIFKYTVRAVLDAPARHGGSTLLSVPLMFNRPDYRSWVLKHSRNHAVKEFFTHEFDSWSKPKRDEYVQPILNKIDQFLLSDTLRNIIGQGQSTIDLSYIINNRKILLIDLDKAQIGDDDANILGSLLVTGIWLATLRRSTMHPGERIPFYCYLDEFHSFTTGAFSSILSESRKYGLGLVLAGQYIDQIKHRDVRDAVFGNCGNLCAFRVGNEDAERIAPTLNMPAHILENLPVGHASLMHLQDGTPYTPLIRTPLIDKRYYRGVSDRVTRYSQKRYTRPVETIERQHVQWLNRITNRSKSDPRPRSRNSR